MQELSCLLPAWGPCTILQVCACLHELSRRSYHIIITSCHLPIIAQACTCTHTHRPQHWNEYSCFVNIHVIHKLTLSIYVCLPGPHPLWVWLCVFGEIRSPHTGEEKGWVSSYCTSSSRAKDLQSSHSQSA